MLSEAISLYYEAKKMYYNAEGGSKEEARRLGLLVLAANDLLDECKSYEEAKRITNHITFLCDKIVWPNAYGSVLELHKSISSKA